MVVLALWRVNPISPRPELSRNSGNSGFRFPLGCSCLLAGLDSYVRSLYHSVILFLTGNVPHRLDPVLRQNSICSENSAIPGRYGCSIQVIPSPPSAKILSRGNARAVYLCI